MQGVPVTLVGGRFDAKVVDTDPRATWITIPYATAHRLQYGDDCPQFQKVTYRIDWEAAKGFLEVEVN